MLFLQFLVFGMIGWFGLYICNRDASNVRLRLTGVGLIVSSCGLGAWILLPYAQQTFQSMFVAKVRDISVFLPIVFWLGGIGSFRSPSDPKFNSMRRVWKYWVLMPHLIGMIWLLYIDNANMYVLSYQIICCATLILCVVFSMIEAAAAKPKEMLTQRMAIYAPLLIYAFAVVIVLFMQDSPWRSWGLVGNSAALLFSAIHVMAAEIKQQGESWLPDFFRSLDYSLFFTLIFSGQVALVIWQGMGFNFTMLLLLLISVAVSIAFQVFVYPIRAMLDHIAFITFPKLRQERTRLRLVESVQVRIDEEAITAEMNEEDLFRYTRRALSHFGDLERLASNPLTQLGWIHRRLKERGAADEVLERAVELKSALLESIGQLKPRREDAFGTTEEWRYYNALYFPYIVGVKPYSQRYSDEHLDAASRDALAWFRTYVPERTCYNWQNAAARLVALTLKEKSAS